MPEGDKRWGVVINETGLNFYSPDAAEYWHQRRQLFEAAGTITILKGGAMGDTIRIGPFTRKDANFMRDHLIEHGAATTHVQVRAIPKKPPSAAAA
ncbi:hypothetical protein [Nonomuraea sp. NPDC049784]|uniref:hypothetical protein n=1 Tax=Nonomuraea sp. NPDC049784 TaxID=3154361 RepID=UPI0033EEDE3D